MRRIGIKQVDVFTQKAFFGNPAAVVLHAEGLTDREMQAIAKEMNLSETAFVLPSKNADFRLRWFTPKRESEFCGHATVASLHVLAEEGLSGMNQDGAYTHRIETMVGTISTEVQKSSSLTRIVLTSPPMALAREEIESYKLAEALNIEDNQLDDSLPIMRERKLNYLYIPLKGLGALGSGYHYEKLRVLGEEFNIKGFTVFTRETFDEDSEVHSRFYSPFYGIREDPMTGSSHGPLGVYLISNGVVRLNENNEARIKAEQGDFLSRPGRMIVRVTKERNGTYAASLICNAVTVLDGTLVLP